jgi:hypothetical protein
MYGLKPVPFKPVALHRSELLGSLRSSGSVRDFMSRGLSALRGLDGPPPVRGSTLPWEAASGAARRWRKAS